MRLLAAAALALLAITPARAADDAAFVAWAQANARPLSLCPDIAAPSPLDAVGETIGEARVATVIDWLQRLAVTIGRGAGHRTG